ncbi:VOC family protein [Phytomonospora endophytica]|uniref:Catechol 2,3-dioxygenase-like lactoylglutathione lyase family enzyme n=1 Tax=Phytomonospora endophytica TaxID=714109 RepID=A0A841FSZ3_9ACTN|nr:VOC family protein [Phytomonospora endophytica]MBB6035100.1 catechol 2,3-dioxygenase-like lactoylglutathione lyase family enzyme [Phytomonospora endophytica]GIG64151.1 hypothetical protein Pen01_04460 [Phytomonospora endophytica]
MRIHRTSVFVDDQEKALRFYTEVLGFQKKDDVPLGEDRWLTVVSPEEPAGTELLLEPSRHPAVRAFQEGLAVDGIPATSFAVDDLDAEVERLRSRGAVIVRDPVETGPVSTAIIDDTCGNLVQLLQYL